LVSSSSKSAAITRERSLARSNSPITSAKRFAVGEKESAVVRGGVAVAFGFAQAEQDALEPDALGLGGVFDQPDRCGQ